MTSVLRFVVLGVMLLQLPAYTRPAAAQEIREGRTASPMAAVPTGRDIVAKDRIATLQNRLTVLGYDPGPSDGIVGPRTRAAIRAFQQAGGLPVDGRFSQQLEAEVSGAYLAATDSSRAGAAPGAILLAVFAFGAILLIFGRRSRRQWRQSASGTTYAPVRNAPSAPSNVGGVIVGKAYVTDGDGIRISRREIRFAGLDAPEWDQWAKHGDGYWFKHGRRVKSELIRKIGGQSVHVAVEGCDKYGRLVGTVTHNDEDIGAWLVRNGHAIAAYDERYKNIEQEARRAKCGLWSHDVTFDPRYWRRRRQQAGHKSRLAAKRNYRQV